MSTILLYVHIRCIEKHLRRDPREREFLRLHVIIHYCVTNVKKNAEILLYFLKKVRI